MWPFYMSSRLEASIRKDVKVNPEYGFAPITCEACIPVLAEASLTNHDVA